MLVGIKIFNTRGKRDKYKIRNTTLMQKPSTMHLDWDLSLNLKDHEIIAFSIERKLNVQLIFHSYLSYFNYLLKNSSAIDFFLLFELHL